MTTGSMLPKITKAVEQLTPQEQLQLVETIIHRLRKTGKRLDTPRQIVSKWRKRFFDQGLAGLEELPRRGRPGRFPPLRGRRR